jgi:Tfp pilus assembly protein PilN
MGLALQRVPQKTVAKGETNGFHDISLNILSNKYRAKARPASGRRRLLPVAISVAIVLLLGLYLLKSQAGAETVRLQTELSTVSQMLHEARLAFNTATETEDTINGIAADTEALKGEHQYILGRRGELATDLELVTGALPASSYFTSIQIANDQITIEGETDASSKVISYAEALEEQLGFSEVRIANITEAEASETESSTISFTIVMSK